MFILSNTNIDSSELKSLLSPVNNESSYKIYFEDTFKFTVTLNDAKIWLTRSDESLAEYEVEDINRVTSLLGDAPKSLFILELSSEPESSNLGIEICFKIGKKWEILVDDIYEDIYTYNDIKKMHENGQGFE